MEYCKGAGVFRCLHVVTTLFGTEGLVAAGSYSTIQTSQIWQFFWECSSISGQMVGLAKGFLCGTDYLPRYQVDNNGRLR